MSQTTSPRLVSRTLQIGLVTIELRLQDDGERVSTRPILLELPAAPLRFHSLEEVRQAIGPHGLLEGMNPSLRQTIADLVAELGG